MAGAEGDLETRFSHLLKPIRDLTKNWDVDIATQLEEYLEEIEQIEISFDGGTTKMNFAQAALLIQGSACVYSKKVEYLYTLVYQAMDLLTSKKRQKQAASVDADGNDQDANFNNGQDRDEEFLTLDDIKEHKNIDMKHDGDDTFADKTVATVPRTPMALVQLDDGEKGENPLISRKGEVLGSRNDFKLNTCNIHPSGTMLLDLSHLNLLELTFRNIAASTPYPHKVNGLLGNNEAAAAGASMEAQQVDEGLPQDISMDDNDAGIPGFEDIDDVATDENPDKNLDIEKRDGMQLRRSERNKLANAVKLPSKSLVDPWIKLDPHQADAAPERPTRKAKKFRLPKSIKEEGAKKQRKRKKNSSPKVEAKPALPSIAQFCSKAYHSHSSKFPSNPLKVPKYKEFEPKYWKEFQRRQIFVRRRRKKLVEDGRAAELEMDDDNEDEDGNALPAEQVDEDDDVHVDFQLPDLPDVISAIEPDQSDVLGMAPASFLDDAPVVGSYEELVQKHVEGFLASAQQYAQITELSRRVGEWEEKIYPRLQEEEEHPPFDIHKYGTEVLNSCDLKETNPKIPFRRVVLGKPPYEVCRLFLATLQLANNYNVEISRGSGLEEAVDTMAIQLLNKKRHFEELEDYKAPSVDK